MATAIKHYSPAKTSLINLSHESCIARDFPSLYFWKVKRKISTLENDVELLPHFNSDPHSPLFPQITRSQTQSHFWSYY